ncbi:MAG: polysaccharide deacetylase family protein [Oscillospiraceae bacterium]|nr:polysaccharide deacetylase family protein [Oscillospiraceae bacterium]
MNKIKKNVLSVIMTLTILCNSLSGLSFSYAQAETKLIALTFDDGPNTTTTNEVLDLLEEYHAVASFFLIGDKINAESAVSVKRAYDMGCEINNHSKSHTNMSEMTAEQLQKEISYVDKYVYEITGEQTKFFRPPYIEVSQSMYDTIEQPFICGIGCNDTITDVTAEQRAETVISNAKDGLIVLMHDFTGNTQTVEALKIIIPTLQKEGYEFVTLTELFARQGEVPKRNMFYSQVTKYPCDAYKLYQEVSSEKTELIKLDAETLKGLGKDYAIEVHYSASTIPPVIALQKWSADVPIWKAVEPIYSNGEKACFLASDVLTALQELNMNYIDLDRICLSSYGGTIPLTDAKILIKNDNSISLKGDVNQDGAFNLTDVIMLQKWLLCCGELTDWKAGDFTEDNMINIFDLLLMKRELFLAIMDKKI